MRNWLFLPLSAALLAHAAPPAQVEIEYELRRNGSPIAEVHERLEHGNGSYQLTETWRGKGFYRLLGKANRFSRGSTRGADGRFRTSRTMSSGGSWPFVEETSNQ